MKVDFKKLERAKKKSEDLSKKFHDAFYDYQKLITEYGGKYGMFCDQCGETDPKHGFYPLQAMGFDGSGNSMGYTGFTCNKCARSPEEYEKMFGEKP